MPSLKYWDAVAQAWQRLPTGPFNEVAVGTDPPDGEIMWADTDNTIARTQLDAFEIVGPYTSSVWVTRLLPWKADVLVVWAASCYSGTIGYQGCALAVDGVARSHAGYWFSQTSSHKQVSASVVLRGMAPGNHTWGIYHEYGVTSDGGDHAHISLVAEPVY